MPIFCLGVSIALVLIHFCRQDFPLVTIQRAWGTMTDGFNHPWRNYGSAISRRMVGFQNEDGHLDVSGDQSHGISIFQDLPRSGTFLREKIKNSCYNIFQTSFHGKFMKHTCLNQLLLGRSTFFLQSLHLDGTLTPPFTTGWLVLFGVSGFF